MTELLTLSGKSHNLYESYLATSRRQWGVFTSRSLETVTANGQLIMNFLILFDGHGKGFPIVFFFFNYNKQMIYWPTNCGKIAIQIAGLKKENENDFEEKAKEREEKKLKKNVTKILFVITANYYCRFFD